MQVLENRETQRPEGIKIYEELGAGSYGKVYRAYDPTLQQTVAIKMVQLDTSEGIEELLLELKFLSELRCEQITQYFGASIHDTILFVKMEYCAAGSCRQILRVHAGFSEESTAYILNSVLKGLNYIHSQDKIHRDLKADNILVTKDCQVKIADFGVSVQLSATTPGRCSTMGTPYWMAPEVIEKSEYNTAIDIWSFGIVAHELLTGEPPLRKVVPSATEAMYRIVNGPSPRLPRLVRGQTLSKGLVTLVNDCVSKDPKFRPTAQYLLGSRYMRNRNIPGCEFKAIVNSVYNTNREKYRYISPGSIDDIDRLAPPKTKKSRIERPQCHGDDSMMCDDFELTFESQDEHMSAPKEKAGAGNDRSPLKAIVNHSETPPVPSRSPYRIKSPIQTPHLQLNRPPKLGANFKKSPPFYPTPGNQQPVQAQPEKPSRLSTPIDRSIHLTVIRRALVGLESRGKSNLNLSLDLRKLYGYIEKLNEKYPGFTQALLEELWREIRNNQYSLQF